MAALNFPSSPSTNQIYTANGKSWRFDGTSWKTFYILNVEGGGTGNTSYILGDILVGAGTSILTLPIGSNNFVLTVDTTTPSLLSWKSVSGISITNINGITSSYQYFNVGTSGTGFNISSSGSTHTFNIPIAGSGSTGLVSTLAQTFAGEKTFTSAIIGDLTGTATTAGFASTANYALLSGYGITAGFANTASYSYQSGYGLTSGFATTASYSYQSGYGITSGFATTASNVNLVNAITNSQHSIVFSSSSSGSGVALSSNTTISFNPSTYILSTSGLAITGLTSSTSTTTGALTIAGGVGIGGSLFLSSSVPSSLSGVIVNNGVVESGTWAGNVITSLYGGTGQNDYTTGDILVGLGDTLAKFPVGTDTYVLTADSSSSIGVTWKAAASSGTTVIGSPTDGTYTDGFFNSWTDSTTISNAFDDVNELLALIAPAKPNDMTGLSLTATSVPTYYSARIAGGLGTEWYQAGYGTGSLISSKYFVTGSHTLSTPSTSTTFYAGTLVTSTYGILSFSASNYLTGSGATVNQIDMTVNYTAGSSSGNLTLTAMDIYNSIWTKANARISTYTPSHGGYEALYISHSTNSQSTASYTMWYDPWSSGKSPSFSQSATASTYSESLKWLSGIGYYSTGTGFSVYFKGAAGIYSSCYNVTQTYAISATGLVTSTGLPASPPLYTDELDKSGANHVRVSLNSASASSFNKYLTVTLYKAHNTTAASNASIARAINTYATVSTDTYEGFQDEARRLVIGSGIAFTSTIDMDNGNAQVRSGTLQYPTAADYDTEWGGTHTFTGDQEYQRYFYKTSASTGSLTFTGFTASNIAAYGTGSVNVLLYLENDAKWFDLGVLQGSNANDGSTRSLAISAKTSASSGTLNWSLGTYTTGVSGSGNSGRYRAVVIFRNNTYSMTSITSA